MPYASETRVPVSKTRLEIETLLQKHKCEAFAIAYADQPRKVQIEFQMNGRRIRFGLPLPPLGKDQHERARWRGLLLAIKAKLDSVERGIESFDQAFLPHIVMPDGRTFGEISVPQLEYYRD